MILKVVGVFGIAVFRSKYIDEGFMRTRGREVGGGGIYLDGVGFRRLSFKLRFLEFGFVESGLS